MCSPVNLSTEKWNPEPTLSHDSPRSSSTKVNFQLKISNSFDVSHPAPVVRTSQFNYTILAPVNASNNEELANVSVSGAGTKNDPYVLERWNITTTGVHGIAIHNTTAFFVIRNCWITTGNAPEIHGIYIANVARGTLSIVNNTCYNNSNGIFIESSANATIMNNTCSQNQNHGIGLIYSNNSQVIDNLIVNSGDDGISLWDSGSSQVINNTCIDNMAVGIHFIHSGSSTVMNNTCIQNGDDGITIRWYSNDTIIVNNFCKDNDDTGINIVNSWNSVVINNFCSQNTGHGFYFWGNCNSTVVNNICTQNGWSGIVFDHFGNSTIVNNTCNRNGRGEGTSGDGIVLFSCTNIVIANNSCRQNDPYDGIHLFDCRNVTVLDNEIIQNNDYGIHLMSTNGCLIKGNYIIANQAYGVYLDFNCENNLIHHNKFIDNNQGATQGYDNGGNNQWYDPDTEAGNYWSDYSGVGVYQIDGYEEAIDPYPLFEPLWINWEEFWDFLVFGNPKNEVFEITPTTEDSKVSLTGVPFFVVFLVSLGLFGHFRRKRK